MTSPTHEERRVVVSDTTPIIALASIERLDLLSALYEEILIPPAVRREVLAGGSRRIGVEAFQRANFFRERSLAQPRNADLLIDLGRGEAEALILAQEVDADLVLLDERQARGYARYLGLPMTGTLGILMKAKKQGFLEKIQPAIRELRGNEIRLSDALIERALREAGEL